MRFVYMVTGFNLRIFTTFLPDPCVFVSEKRAEMFCKELSDENINYTYRKVRENEEGQA